LIYFKIKSTIVSLADQDIISIKTIDLENEDFDETSSKMSLNEHQLKKIKENELHDLSKLNNYPIIIFFSNFLAIIWLFIRPFYLLDIDNIFLSLLNEFFLFTLSFPGYLLLIIYFLNNFKKIL
jgi:hypothetical protein